MAAALVATAAAAVEEVALGAGWAAAAAWPAAALEGGSRPPCVAEAEGVHVARPPSPPPPRQPMPAAVAVAVAPSSLSLPATAPRTTLT